MQRSGRAAGDNGQFCHISISFSNKLNLQTGPTVITYSFSRNRSRQTVEGVSPEEMLILVEKLSENQNQTLARSQPVRG